ncbi:MAG: IS66 family transposase, partial [Cyclobacteriaceae bacterium]|nr:IS66 family transposase [Cyclobacteriaceae bacterium]
PDQIDHFHVCTLDCCPGCGSNDIVDQEQPLVLQQVELPEVKAFTTQFNCTKYRCTSCGEKSFASLPKGIPNSAFGPRLMALVATLTGVFHLAKRDAIRLVEDLYGIKISEGSVINVEERVATALNEPYDRIHRYVMNSVLPKHFDETSWRNQGKNNWAWVATTTVATCFRIDVSRSKEAFKRFASSLNSAPIVTDRYSAYKDLEQPHQYCLAHLIRDFRKYAERKGPDGKIGAVIEQELLQMCRTQREFREGKITRRSGDTRFRHQKMRLEDHFMDGLANGSDDLSSLCDRLYEERDKLWVFSQFTDVDSTNNLAERALRRLVLWRKKSYGTRSDRGKYFVERISTVGETIRKAGSNIFAFIIEAVTAFYHGKTAPLVVPANGF